MKKHLIYLLSMIAVLGFAASGQALTLTLNHSFGSDPVSGEIVLDITTAADGSYADIRMDLTDLSSPEFVKELYLNITDTSAISGLDYGATDGNVTSFGVADATYKAGGDGRHDIYIGWHPSAKDRLNAGNVYAIRILGSGLTEDMFDDRGEASDKGHFRAVAKVNSTGGGGGSDWVGDGDGRGGAVIVPEPTSALVFSAGLLLTARRIRQH